MSRNFFQRVASLLGAQFLVAALAASALPAAAKTMIYVPESYGFTGAWYVALNATDGKARLVGDVGAKAGTYTDNGIEILVSLSKPLSYEALTGPGKLDCNGQQYLRRTDIKQVLFRRVDGTGVNKGKSRVVEIGEVVDIGGCTPGAKTPFGSVSDEGFPMLHRSTASREPMTDVVAGFTIAGMREPLRPDPYSNPYASLAADVVNLESATAVRFKDSNSLVNAALTSDQWLVLDLPGFQRGYTRFSVNTGNGIETWLEAEWKDGKPQTVTNLMMTKPLPGASFGTKAATSRMWESFVGLGTNNPFLFYLYRDFTGDRVQKDIAAATETRTPIAWHYEDLEVVSSRTTAGGKLIERAWVPLGRTGKYMSVMELEVHTPPGGLPYVYIPPRVVFYVDRGAAYPPAP
jgi:hypothetical protein